MLPGALPGLLRRGALARVRGGLLTVVVKGCDYARGKVCVADGLIDWSELTTGRDEIVGLGEAALYLGGEGEPNDSCDIAARWLAPRVGLLVGNTAPEWILYSNPLGGSAWRLKGADGRVVWFVSEMYPWTTTTHAGATYVVVPGISAITVAGPALVAACLAVGGAS